MNLQDIYIIEGVEEESSELEYYAAIQRAINAGAWSLQGSYGRTMMAAIEDGYCLLGEYRARDCWGNTIPSRHDVQPGTKGSHQYVADRNGDEYADLIANV